MQITFAPKFFNNLGAALYPAPFAQSKIIFNPFKLNFFGKLFLSISIDICIIFHIVITLMLLNIIQT